MRKYLLSLFVLFSFNLAYTEQLKEISITWPRLPLANFSANGIDAKVVFREDAHLPQADEYAFIREMLIEKFTKAECNEENAVFCIKEIKSSLRKALGEKAPSEITLVSQACYMQPYSLMLSFSMDAKDDDISFTIDFNPSFSVEDSWSDLHLSFQAKVKSSSEYWTPSELYSSLMERFKLEWQAGQSVDSFSQTFLNAVCRDYPFFKDVNFQVSGKKMSDEEEIEDVSVLCKHPCEPQSVS